MEDRVILLSIPGLRESDLGQMPALNKLTHHGDRAPLVPSFPAVTWPVQANLLTGVLPHQHGVIANGFYWRDRQEVEMWTAGNDKIQSPQIWDILHQHDPRLTSAVWFPMLSKGCGADYVCMPAPVHNPDGTESLWCYTKPAELYGELRGSLGHFPLQNFWGPLANLESTRWIARSAALAAKRFRPSFFYMYLPHLDYAAQREGPDSAAAMQAVADLDGVLDELIHSVRSVLDPQRTVWLVASEYTIVPVNHVSYPNRILRAAGLLSVREEANQKEMLDYAASRAWALVDHQFSHIFVRDHDANTIRQVQQLFTGSDGIDEVLAGRQLERHGLQHERSGDVVLISTARSWQAYYWWDDDARAPNFARTVDIHRKPGYDPVELHIDRVSRTIPLDATLVRGSHGAPAREEWQRGILLSSQRGVFVEQATADTDVAEIVLRQFGI